MAFSSGTFSRLFDWTTDRDSGIRIRADRFDQELDGFATGLSTTILKDGTQTTTAEVPFAFGISIVDNKAITLGTNSDITIQYDETTNDSLEIAAAVEGAALGIVLKSDQGDDNADQHKLSIADGGTLTLASKISGSFVTYLTHTPNSTVASSTLAVAGNLTVGGNLTLGSGAELSEAELEMLDGITAGTVAASKAVVVDANKDIASFRNITLTGELDAGSLDVSGDADIDGTLEADAMTLNGSAITTTATLSTGISNGNVLVATSGIADNDFLRVDGTSIEGRSASEVLSDIGGQASLTFGISNTNAVKIDSASVADDEFARFTANGLESRSAAETLSDIGASPVAGSSSIVTTGALDSGSITSGFGAIDNGSSNITTTGALSSGSLTATGNVSFDGGDFVFNESSADKDFRVESNGNANMLLVDGGNDAVVISDSTSRSVNSAEHKLQISHTDYNCISAIAYKAAADGAVLTLGKSRNGTIGSNTIVQDNDALGAITFVGADGTDLVTQGARISAEVDGTPGANDLPTRLVFLTTADGASSVSERMRIESDGTVQITSQDLKVGNNASADSKLQFDSSGSDWSIGIDQSDSGFLKISNGTEVHTNTRLTFKAAGLIQQDANVAGLMQDLNNANTSSPIGIRINFTGADPNNVDNYFLAGEASTNNRFKIYSAGTIKNSTGTYTSFSDERLKTDIVDAKSQWDDIKALKFKNFTKFDNPDLKQLGLIAQDVEKTSANLVFETPPEIGEIKHNSVFGTLYEDGDTIPEGKKVGDVKEVKSQVKNVKDSILYMKAVKALQEAMTRIETLEAKVKALEEA